jgi:hypothetical protein
MPGKFFDDWFDDGDAYFDEWFDEADVAPPAKPSVNPGVSKKRILGTTAPRPQVPPWKQVPGATGVWLTEIRNFLSQVQEKDAVWGNTVTVTFPAADVPVRILTGLGGPSKGYRLEGASADVRVWDAVTPASERERGVLWLQASGPATVKLYVY